MIIFKTSYVHAYPNFIGMGYNACITCHYNPYGNGPLNDYGRSLSATAISDRIIYKKTTSEEEIADNSGFLYMKEFHRNIRPSVDYRGLYLDRGVDKNDKNSEFINMQADFNTVFRANGKNNLFISVTYGYAPVPRALKGTDEEPELMRSREHYIGWKPSDEYGLYAGLQDKVFGIRVPDHTSFSRSVTGLGQSDQAHGVVIHIAKKNFEIGLNPFIGNLSQDVSLRQKGASAKLEYNLSYNNKPGLSLLKSESDFFEREMISLHHKMGFSKGSSLLFEVGRVSQKAVLSDDQSNSLYVFMQNHMLLRRGLYLFVTTDYLQPMEERGDFKIFKLGPGVQYFPFQGLELRADLYNSKSSNIDSVTKDSWDFTGQVHLWF